MSLPFCFLSTCSALPWRVILVLWTVVVRCVAHDPGLSSAEISIGPHEVTVQMSFAPADIAGLSNSESHVPPAAGAVEWRAGGSVVAPLETGVQHSGDNLDFRLVFPRAGKSEATFVSVLLEQLPHGHRQLLTVRDAAGTTVDSQLLSAVQNRAEIHLASGAPNSSAPSTFVGLVLLGIEHILTGYDHLLFLCALLLVCESFRSTVGVITCFTVAHSITLALATFQIVSLPGSLVEPLIAASIVYVGIENVVVKRPIRWRWLLTFSFGLIHGLGFAGVLRDLGIGTAGSPVAIPLLCFNLGVELGQIAIAAAVLPLLFQVRRIPRLVERGIPVASLAIACAGAWWLIQRTTM